MIQPPGGDEGPAKAGDEPPVDDPATDDEPDAAREQIDEVRAAAGEVIGSLKKLLEAAGKVVADPESFDQVVNGGKGLLDALTSGFVQESNRSGDVPDQEQREVG